MTSFRLRRNDEEVELDVEDVDAHLAGVVRALRVARKAYRIAKDNILSNDSGDMRLG